MKIRLKVASILSKQLIKQLLSIFPSKINYHEAHWKAFQVFSCRNGIKTAPFWLLQKIVGHLIKLSICFPSTLQLRLACAPPLVNSWI